MPVRFHPGKDAAHRLACLSLYRALLKECTKLPFPATSKTRHNAQSPISTLQALVKHRFRQDRDFQGYQLIRNALQLGRQTLLLLEQAGTGSRGALNTLTSTISASIVYAERKHEVLKQFDSERGQRKIPKKLVKIKKRIAHISDKSYYRRDPTRVPVLERPAPYEQALKHADGRRKVPSYFVVSRIPFLRYTSHQPLSLTRYIQSELRKQLRSSRQLEENDETIALAEMEDRWDRQMSMEHRINQQHEFSLGSQDAQPWAQVHHNHKSSIQERMSLADNKKVLHGQKLWKVFLKEEALAKQENAQRKEEGRRRWLEKQKVEEENDREQTGRVAALFESQDTSQTEWEDEDSVTRY